MNWLSLVAAGRETAAALQRLFPRRDRESDVSLVHAALDTPTVAPTGQSGSPTTLVKRALATVRSFIATDRALVLTVLLITFVGHRWAEKIPVNGGFGWDGTNYGRMARDFEQVVFISGISAYSIFRVLPSGLIYYSSKLLAIPHTDANILCLFGLWNVALCGLIAATWCRLAHRLNINRGGMWLGITALFANYAVLKWSAYYAVLTDTYAFAIGMLMLYCYIVGKRWWLTALAVVGAFTWPALIYHTIFLFLFPYRGATRVPAQPVPRLSTTLFSCGVAATFVALAGCLFLLGGHGFHSRMMALSCGQFAHRSFNFAAAASLASAFWYLFLGLRGLSDWPRLFSVREWLARASWPMFAVWIGVALATGWIGRFLAHGPSEISTHDALLHLGWMSIRKPGLFFLAHVVYFGPVLLLAALNWKRVCGIFHGNGFGLTLCAMVNLLLALDCESRHLIHFLPVIVLVVVQSVAGLRWRAVHYGLFAGISLVCSKVWLDIAAMPDPYNFEEFPTQLLFMNLGPWMSWSMYFLQGGCAAAVVALFYWLLPRAAIGERPAGMSSHIPATLRGRAMYVSAGHAERCPAPVDGVCP